MTNAHATMKLLTMRTKVEKNVIIYTNKQTLSTVAVFVFVLCLF